MNRRHFLRALAATTMLTAVPVTLAALPVTDDWEHFRLVDGWKRFEIPGFKVEVRVHFKDRAEAISGPRPTP